MPAPGERSPGLHVDGICARYGRLVVTRDVSFTVAPGEVLALLGPNGAGKTAVAGAVAGELRSRGRVAVGSRSLDGLPAHRRARAGLAYVPEQRGLFTGMTVLENLQLGGRLAPASRRRARIDAALETFPKLRPRIRQRAGMLSGGEQQMLAIAKALCVGPSVLLVDEPSQGLAPQILDHLARVLDGIRRQDIAVVLIEQNVAFAAQCCDRFVVLSGGRVVRRGDGHELADRISIVDSYLANPGEDHPVTEQGVSR